jgi:hypothetical protein
VLLLYAVMIAPQPAAQRWVAVAITLLLFGVPVVLLALPVTRRVFAIRVGGPEMARHMDKGGLEGPP